MKDENVLGLDSLLLNKIWGDFSRTKLTAGQELCLTLICNLIYSLAYVQKAEWIPTRRETGRVLARRGHGTGQSGAGGIAVARGLSLTRRLLSPFPLSPPFASLSALGFTSVCNTSPPIKS